MKATSVTDPADTGCHRDSKPHDSDMWKLVADMGHTKYLSENCPSPTKRNAPS